MIHPLLLALIAIIPLLIIFYLGYVRVWVWIQVIPLTCAAAAFIAFLIWQVPFLTVVASFVQGLSISLQHIFLLISIALFMEVLRATGSIDAIRNHFLRISNDRRIQGIAVAWFFGSFLEGMMGFAFTGATCAVILVGIGFPPYCAILLGMIGPVTASSFSCVGTPILFHAANSLQQPDIAVQLSAAGMTLNDYLRSIAGHVGLINGIVGAFVPLGMIMMMTRFFGKNHSWRDALDIAPFALFCGFSFSVPYALTAIFFGPQYPPIIGALVGFALMMTALRLKLLLPRQEWHFEPFSKWEPEWYEGRYEKPESSPQISWKLAWAPFAILFFLLTLTHWPGSALENTLKSYTLQKNYLFGTPVSLYFQPFFMPCTFFILLASLLTMMVHRFKNADRVLNQRLSIFASKAFLSLPFTMPIACIYINSGMNHSGYPSMIQVIAEQMTHIPGARFLLPILTPFISGAATDVASSGMYSVALLSSYQHHVGQILSGKGALFVALHIVAATTANMFAGHYLNGVSLHAGKEGLTGPVGRKALRVLFIYLMLSGVVAALLLNFLNKTV